jgi:hypothetical protein
MEGTDAEVRELSAVSLVSGQSWALNGNAAGYCMLQSVPEVMGLSRDCAMTAGKQAS